MKALVPLILVVCSFVPLTFAANKDALCGACNAVVDELKYAIKHTDQKKTMDLGSQRLGSDGSVKDKRVVKYAGSEVHLIELMEKICEEMNNYALSIDDKTGAKSYIRFNSRPGESVTLSNVRIDSGTMQELKEACTSFISQYDDDVIDMFVEKEKDIKKQLCHHLTGYCKKGSRSEL